jgi:hypothetical protein
LGSSLSATPLTDREHSCAVAPVWG